jgi:hypothetical protein
VKKFPPPILVIEIQIFLPVWLAAVGRVTVLPEVVKKTLLVVLLGML